MSSPAGSMGGTVEANFDGLVGPTHNYAGLSFGNVASAKNAEQPSDPRGAVLQGLAKMKALADLGMAQGVLPPQERPHIPSLKRLGFSGKDAEVLRKAHSEAPGLLAAMASASSMWTANAATVSPGVTVGAVLVAEPLTVGPVMVRFVPGSTVASAVPLDPKL